MLTNGRVVKNDFTGIKITLTYKLNITATPSGGKYKRIVAHFQLPVFAIINGIAGGDPTKSGIVINVSAWGDFN